MQIIKNWQLTVTDEGMTLSTPMPLQSGESVELDGAGITLFISGCDPVHQDYTWIYEADCRVED